MTDETIIKLFETQKNDLKEIIESHGQGTRAIMRSEIDRIDEMDKLRNGNIKSNCDDLEELRDETSQVRWVNRNPGRSIIFLLVIFFGIAYAYHKVDVSYFFETKGVRVMDNSSHVVTREPIR